jgi:hypothetical protein
MPKSTLPTLTFVASDDKDLYHIVPVGQGQLMIERSNGKSTTRMQISEAALAQMCKEYILRPGPGAVLDGLFGPGATRVK